MREFAASGVPRTVILGDEAGVLHPERARTWIPLMRQTAPGKELEMHFHNKTGMGAVNYIIGVEERVTIVHTAVESMANGPSMPSTAVTADNMRRLGHEVMIDESRLAEVSTHLAAIAIEEGHQI